MSSIPISSTERVAHWFAGSFVSEMDRNSSESPMAVPHLSCPYCNAILTEIEPLAGAGRILCPQCGETFPLPKGMSLQEGIVSPDSPRTDGENHGRSTGPKLSNRTIALSLLALMGLVAIVFLGFALQTQDIRRQHDTSLPKSQSITIPIGVAA